MDEIGRQTGFEFNMLRYDEATGAAEYAFAQKR